MERRFNWEHIKSLPVFDWIPDHYNIEEENIFRSPLLLINHLYWNQLVDYKFYNQINSTGEPIITVHAYYTAGIHNLRRLKVVEIPANEPFNQTITIKNHSRLRQESIKQARLEHCIDTEHGDSLRFFIEKSFGIDNLFDYCTPEEEEFTVKGDGSVRPYDRVWVGWIIDLVIGIYREDVEGNISLVGCSDYLYEFMPMIYPKSNNYWAMRTKAESRNASPRYGYNTERFYVLPPDEKPLTQEQELESYQEWNNYYEKEKSTRASKDRNGD